MQEWGGEMKSGRLPGESEGRSEVVQLKEGVGGGHRGRDKDWGISPANAARGVTQPVESYLVFRKS